MWLGSHTFLSKRGENRFHKSNSQRVSRHSGMSCRSLAGSFFFEDTVHSAACDVWSVPSITWRTQIRRQDLHQIIILVFDIVYDYKQTPASPPPKKKSASIFGATKLNSACPWSDLSEMCQSQRQEPEKSLVRTTERKRANEIGKRLKVRQPGWLMASKVPRRWATCEITHVRFFSGLQRKL